MTNIIRERPPVYDRIVAVLGEPGENTVYTYGDTIYSPHGQPSDDVIEHEKVHIEQQASWGADEWWRLYLEEDPEFRRNQETEAYFVQYRWLKTKIKDRNELARHAFHIARTLAGPLYGHLMSFNEALTRIKGAA